VTGVQTCALPIYLGGAGIGCMDRLLLHQNIYSYRLKARKISSRPASTPGFLFSSYGI
jgi:hypothetical protein